MTHRLVKWSPYLVAALALALAATPATAAKFIPPPLDPSESDALTVFRPNGKVRARQPADEETEDRHLVITVNIFGNPAEFGHATALLEPDGTFSDIFGVVKLPNGKFVIGFVSDIEHLPVGQVSKPFGGPPTIFLPEGLPFYSATQYLDLTKNPAGTTAFFQSDLDAVPEPGSLALMGLGALAMGVYARMRRKR